MPSCFWLLWQHPVEGIRDRIYGFVQFCPKVLDERTGRMRPKTDMALDLSFGSIGYALVLARPFKVVCSHISQLGTPLTKKISWLELHGITKRY